LAARAGPERIWTAAAVYRRTRLHYPPRFGGVKPPHTTMDGGYGLC
jgi:hypothetical protein